MRDPKSLARFYETTNQIVTIDRESPPRILFSGEDLLVEDLPVGTRVIYPKPPLDAAHERRRRRSATRSTTPRTPSRCTRSSARG